MWLKDPAPKYENEKPKTYRLFGNTSNCIELCGWSVMLPLKFNNVGISTALVDMIDGKGNETDSARLVKEKCILLKRMETFAHEHQMVRSPVYVQVLAKRKVDILVQSNSQLLMIPLLVVGDISGYCVINSFNEGLQTLWNAVNVGDFLLISSCTPLVPRITYHRGLFSENMFINLELKVQYHSTRSHYIRRFTPLKLSEFRMKDELFDDNCCVLKTPSLLEKEFEESNERAPFLAPSQAKQYYDIVGVIAYVGRTERFLGDSCNTVECMVNGINEEQRFDRFILYRWIKIIDKTSKLFPVKVFVNNATCSSQDLLVPGAIVILSHCQTEDTKYAGRCSFTSHFSQIYGGVSIDKYFMLHPDSFRSTAGDILMKSNYCEIISRKDVQWGIGGTHEVKILNQQRFMVTCRDTRSHSNYKWSPMKRRESRRFFCEGVIMRIVEVRGEDTTTVSFLHPRYMDVLEKKRNKEYTVLENFLPYNCHSNSSWYSFSRKLPPINPQDLLQDKCREVVKKVVAGYSDLCKPLLVPCVEDNNNNNGLELPRMAELDTLESQHYLLLDLLDENCKRWFTCMWKSRSYSNLEKKRKLEQAVNKHVYCFIEVFCVETDYPLEVILHDFVIKEGC